MSGKKIRITAAVSLRVNTAPVEKLSKENVRFKSISTAYSIDYDRQLQLELREQLDEYNCFVDKLFSNRSFYEYFYSHDADVTESEVEEVFGKDFAHILFALKPYMFETRYCKAENRFFDINSELCGEVNISDERLRFEVSAFSDNYPEETEKHFCLWNWDDDSKDYIEFLDRILPEEFADSTTDYYAPMDCFEQSRYDDCPCFENYRAVLKYLQKHGFLTYYSIRPDRETGKWNWFATKQGEIELALLDKSFLSDKRLMRKIELIMSTEGIDSSKPIYFLTNERNQEFISYTPAIFGGHRKLKIYGRLDCKSAKRYIEKGQYVNYRVFFADEETAIAAGYRPCAKCMPEAYKRWKEKQTANG